jgi:hypothetical protein
MVYCDERSREIGPRLGPRPTRTRTYQVGAGLDTDEVTRPMETHRPSFGNIEDRRHTLRTGWGQPGTKFEILEPLVKV